jgi:hypothetical protein
MLITFAPRTPAPANDNSRNAKLATMYGPTLGALIAAKATPVAAKAVRFEVGKTYTCRSICDHDTIYSFTIIARTDKRITFEQHGKRTTRGVSVYDGVESCKPHGSYSMCAVIRADRS